MLRNPCSLTGMADCAHAELTKGGKRTIEAMSGRAGFDILGVVPEREDGRSGDVIALDLDAERNSSSPYSQIGQDDMSAFMDVDAWARSRAAALIPSIP